VRIRTLDGFCRERRIPRIDFLKMDAEGHELFILRGAKSMLRGGQISALSFEFGAANVDSRTWFKDFWDLLTPLYYRFWRIMPGGRLLPIPAYRMSLDGAGKANYVAALMR
jgi:hypothetical protein